MTPSLATVAVAASLAAAVHAAHAQGTEPSQRGQLLYETHCVTCHTTQMHWRERRRVRDWESLEAQVRRWQGNASLDWSDEDIRQVARHLNDTIYHLPAPDRVGTR